MWSGALDSSNFLMLSIILCTITSIAYSKHTDNFPLLNLHQGFEKQIGVNHFGHAQLVQDLYAKLTSADNTRQVRRQGGTRIDWMACLFLDKK